MAEIQDLASILAAPAQFRKEDCVVVDLEAGSDAQVRDRALKFQYFPDTVQDSKAVNYSPKEIPGGSLPVYQWVSSGERMVTFTAVFTSDVDPVDVAKLRSEDVLKQEGSSRDNVDIRSAVTWLRRFVLPSYPDNDSLSVRAPRKLLLVLPNSGIGLYGGCAGGGLGPAGGSADSIVCLMTQCDLSIEAFFPSGAPRVATVQLSFVQIPQYNNSVHFPGASNAMESVVNGIPEKYMGYSLPAKLKK